MFQRIAALLAQDAVQLHRIHLPVQRPQTDAYRLVTRDRVHQHADGFGVPVQLAIAHIHQERHVVALAGGAGTVIHAGHMLDTASAAIHHGIALEPDVAQHVQIAAAQVAHHAQQVQFAVVGRDSGQHVFIGICIAAVGRLLLRLGDSCRGLTLTGRIDGSLAGHAAQGLARSAQRRPRLATGQDLLALCAHQRFGQLLQRLRQFDIFQPDFALNPVAGRLLLLAHAGPGRRGSSRVCVVKAAAGTQRAGQGEQAQQAGMTADRMGGHDAGSR